MGKHLMYVNVNDAEVESLLNDLAEIESKLLDFSTKLRRLSVLDVKKEEAASSD